MYGTEIGKNQAKICGQIHKNQEIFAPDGALPVRLPGEKANHTKCVK
jgi:hypothetical protein